MTTMEFEEMKKIWDTQNNEPLYAINEKALHNRILSKKKRADHVVRFSELLLIVVNAGAATFVLGINLLKQDDNVFMYLITAWMLATALYVVISRVRRISVGHRFDRSMLGDLNHAVAMATYQVRLSQIMRWNTLPLSILTILGVWSGGKSTWLIISILIFFMLTYYASAWEHRIYKSRKQELEGLQQKLCGEES